eukprot:jgi/Chlat1/2785/Chrsp187S02957
MRGAKGDEGDDGGLGAFLDRFTNYERRGVPAGAGVDGAKGFELGRMFRLLERLGSPHEVYPVIHVAGTKGKGSTAAYISGMLSQSGYTTGVYTSPHVTTLRERISVDGKEISIGEVGTLVHAADNIVNQAQKEEKGALTHFEVLTALAFAYFAAKRVDVAVIEAGLGGVRDATNVSSTRSLAAAVLTSIGLEHAAALGGSLESITRAKAGIMREDRPCIVAAQQHPEVYKVIQDVAQEKGAQLCLVKNILDVRQLGPSTCSMSARETESPQVASAFNIDVRLSMPGWHIPDDALCAGLEQTHLPGRFQVFSAAEMGLTDAEVDIVLDGAHTPDAAKALALSLVEVYGDWSVTFIIAMADDKDHEGFAQNLFAMPTTVDNIILTRVPIAGSFSRAADPHRLAQEWARAGHRAVVREEFQDALAEAAKGSATATTKPVICVTGSMHVVAAALRTCRDL